MIISIDPGNIESAQAFIDKYLAYERKGCD